MDNADITLLLEACDKAVQATRSLKVWLVELGGAEATHTAGRLNSVGVAVTSPWRRCLPAKSKVVHLRPPEHHQK